MNKISTSSNKATVCASNICATVEGDTAKLVNTIVVFTVLIAAVAFVMKAAK